MRKPYLRYKAKLLEPRTETLEDTTQQELVVEPTLMEVLAQLKAMEKAKGKITTQVAAKRKEAQEAKQLANATCKLAEMQAESR
jgi:capsular polysaccharide biosynthesis protein